MAILGLSFHSLLAQSPDADSTQQKSFNEIPPIENALLWEISGNGLKRPSYLFGTMHLIPKDSFFVTEAMKDRMSEADRLVLEVDISEGTLLASIGAVSGIMMPSGTSLKKILGEEDYAILQTFVEDSLPKNSGMPINMEMINKMKPIFTAEQIASTFCSDNKSGEQVSYEMWFTEKFKDSERPITGLETAAQQLSFLDQISIEEQAQQLMETIKNPYMMCGQYGDMIALYRRQDLTALMKMTAEDAGMGDHLDVLLDKRNQNWIPKIQEMLKTETLFVAVGAGHLAGRQGVIELLREVGYVVKAVH